MTNKKTVPDSFPDAVRSPLRVAGSGDAASRLATLYAEFAGILRAQKVFVRHQGNEHFITSSPTDTLNHPSNGPRAGEPRYEWRDRGDGVLYGFLKADDHSERASSTEAGSGRHTASSQ